MSLWTPDRSAILSLLLDEVTGTQEAIKIRQDYAKIHEICPWVVPTIKVHFTGSRAEGLDLPGSDDDYMTDITEDLKLKVIQSSNETYDISSNTILYLRTDIVNPGFALLEIPRIPLSLRRSIERINGVQYLSSNLMIQNYFNFSKLTKLTKIFKRQGPSIEHQLSLYFEGLDPNFANIEGLDFVQSIHVDVWPHNASEWCQRPRHFGWPTSSTLSSIISYGCDLVAVGDPRSETKLTEMANFFFNGREGISMVF